MLTTQPKRTTIILDGADQIALRSVRELQRTSETEAIRRSIRLAHQLLSWASEGGEVILKKDGATHRLVFM